MSKPRFEMNLTIDTTAHAVTIRNSILNELSGKDIFETFTLSHYTNPSGLIVGIGDWTFNTDVDRDAIKDWVKDQVENHPQVKNWVSSAALSWHRCTHVDSVVENCKNSNYFEWLK